MRAILIIPVFIISVAFSFLENEKPVFYIIGDSTVKNGDGTGKNNQMGWGTVITPYFDTTMIDVRNHAIGGRSTRTFITDGRWEGFSTNIFYPGRRSNLRCCMKIDQ